MSDFISDLRRVFRCSSHRDEGKRNALNGNGNDNSKEDEITGGLNISLAVLSKDFEFFFRG